MQTIAQGNPVVRRSASAFDTLCGVVAGAILLVIFVTLSPFSDLGRPITFEASSGVEAPTYFS